MALKVETGFFAAPGSTGNQTVTLADTGFGTVKAVILRAVPLTSATDSGVDLVLSLGFGTYRGSTPQQWCSHIYADDASGTSACAQGQTSSSILRGLSANTPTLDFDAALVSLGDHEFVVNWTDLPAVGAMKVQYFALGGADITDALVDKFDTTSGTGTVDETVVSGFGKPDLLFITGCKGNTTESDETGSAIITFGVGKDDTSEGCTGFADEHGRGTMELASFQEADIIGLTVSDTAVHNAELSARASWPTDGFQINRITSFFVERYGYLALRGTFIAVIGSGTVPIAGTPPVVQDIAVGATPRGALFFHNVLPTTAGLDNTHADLGLIGIGMMDGTHEGWGGVGDDDTNTTSNTHIHHSETKTIKMFTPSANGTLTSECDGSISSNNIRLSWNDIEASIEREYRYLLLGDGGTAHTASPSDTLALTDAVTKATGLGRTDTLALTDAVAKARGLGRTDSLALADALDRVVVAARALADTLALTDAVTLARSLAIADAVALSDAHTEVASKTAAPADSVALTDNFSRVSTSQRAVDDAVALADARALGRGLAEADAVALTDQTALVSDKARTVDDSETLADQFTRTVAYVRAVNDAVALSDSASPNVGATVSQDDDVALTDNFTRVTVTLRNVADVLALTDNLNREFAALRSVADSVALTDQFARIITANRIVVDGVAVTDLLTAVVGESLVISDFVSLSDAILVAIGAFQYPDGYSPVLASAVTGYIDPAADGRIQFPEPVGIA